MWLFNWFKSTLESLRKTKNAKIVFLGLDDAGKTTLLMRLKEDYIKQMDPTQTYCYSQFMLGIYLKMKEIFDLNLGIQMDTRLREKNGEIIYKVQMESFIQLIQAMLIDLRKAGYSYKEFQKCQNQKKFQQ